MAIVIVGSTALQRQGMWEGKVKDLDVWSDLPLPGRPKKWDLVIMPRKLIDQVPKNGAYATPDAVYTIKCSHFGWDVHWQKTKSHILVLESKGCKIIPELYEALVTYWRAVKGNKEFLSLAQDKKDFFNDHVDYAYDHDYLHELVAYPNEPMYRRCLQDGEEVKISKKKFDLLSHADKVRMFKEEITVIAVERWLVPKRFGVFQAYQLALKKTITRLTKNWATDFLVLNLKDFYKPDFKMFQHVMKELKL